MVLKGNQAMRSLKRTKRENIKCKIKEKELNGQEEC